MLSIVIPIYNEQENIRELYRRLIISISEIDDYEIIFIDDGSQDGSFEIIQSIAESNTRVKCVSFSRNFGHQVAVSAGLMYAKGDAVIVMDGDLQDPPEVIPTFIKKWQEGYDVVYAIRKRRKENIFKRMSYFIFYRVLQKIANIRIPLDSGDFCLMSSRVVLILNSLPEKGRFIRGLRSWVGFKQTGVEFERDKRFSGKPKYNLPKLIKLAFDGLFSFSEVPLRLVLVSGVIVSSLSLVFALYVVLNFIFGSQMYFINRNPGWASLIVSVTFLGGIQLISIGILGEYLGRVFSEVKSRPMFLISKTLGIDNYE